MIDDTDVDRKRPHVRLGAKIREARRRVGYTQSALAKMLDVTRASVAQWETGRAAPGPKRRAPLAAVLKLLLAELPDAAMRLTGRSGGRPLRSRMRKKASASVIFDAALLDELREAGINITAELTAHLRNLVATARAERRWLNDDRATAADANAFVEQHRLSNDAECQD